MPFGRLSLFQRPRRSPGKMGQGISFEEPWRSVFASKPTVRKRRIMVHDDKWVVSLAMFWASKATLKWDGHGATIPDPVTPVFGNPGEPLLQADHPIGFSGGLPEPQTPDPDSEGSVQSPICLDSRGRVAQRK